MKGKVVQILSDDHQGKVWEYFLLNLFPVRGMELFPGPDILEIVEVRFRMQPDAGMDGLHALGQLHDDDHVAGLDLFRQFFCRQYSGDDDDLFFLFDDMQAGQCARRNESGDSGDPFHFDPVLPEFVVYILYGRIEPSIAFRHNDHLFPFVPGGYSLFIQGIVDLPGFGAVFAHREREESDRGFPDFQFFDNTGCA